MARWSDLATWRGPTPNQGGAMQEHRGVVLHIAEGFYEGTISWQRNPDANVSSHWIIGRERGEAAQMVDTNTAAWTQRSGNGHWLSIEFAGFTKGHRLNPGGWERLTEWQVERAAAIIARAAEVHRFPLQLTGSPAGRGIGYHSMGAPAWGHSQCPGPDIIAQRQDILAAAKGDDDMPITNEDANKIAHAVWNRKNPTLGTSYGSIVRWGHNAVRPDRQQTPGATLGFRRDLAAILTAVEGGDVATAVRDTVRAEFAALGPALAAELAEVPAERVEAALRTVLGSLDEDGNGDGDES